MQLLSAEGECAAQSAGRQAVGRGSGQVPDVVGNAGDGGARRGSCSVSEVALLDG